MSRADMPRATMFATSPPQLGEALTRIIQAEDDASWDRLKARWARDARRDKLIRYLTPYASTAAPMEFSYRFTPRIGLAGHDGYPLSFSDLTDEALERLREHVTLTFWRQRWLNRENRKLARAAS